MTSKRQSPTNTTKLERVAACVEALLDEVLRSGFHGVAQLELVISDGTIQQISRTVERVDKGR
jgi:hypothetical protein